MRGLLNRPRLLLGSLLVLLSLQGVWTRPVSTLLVASDPSGRPALVERAAYENLQRSARENDLEILWQDDAAIVGLAKQETPAAPR